MRSYKSLNNLVGWLVFAVATVVYLITLEPTASFWDCGEFIASSDAVDLGAGLRSIAEDLSHEAVVELAADGHSAIARCLCRVERESELTGDTTVERMARFQGQGSHRHEESRVLATDFVMAKDGWRISRARLA